VFKEILVALKIWVGLLPLSIVEMYYQLSSTKVNAQSVIKWYRRSIIKLTILPSSDSRPLVYHSNHQARRAGLLAAGSINIHIYTTATADNGLFVR